MLIRVLHSSVESTDIIFIICFMMRYKADGINAQNDFALHCGGGLKWLLARDWALRADLAYVLDVDSYIDHNYGAGPNNLLAAAGIS